VLAISSACIHKAGGARATAYEKAVTYSTMLAQVNNSIAQGVIQAQQLGQLSVPQTNAILGFQERVARDHKQLSILLGDGPDAAKGNAAAITIVLADVKAQATALIGSGDLGIKNPVSQQTFAGDANSLVDLASSVVSYLQAAGVVQ
jgi:hypothetical protein